MWKKYLLLALGFILITAPGAVEDWLSLIDRAKGGEPMSINTTISQNLYGIIFPILGLAVILFGIWWTRPNKTTDRIDQQHPDEIEQKYPPEIGVKLDGLISQGETLVSKMQTPDFQIYTTANIGESVRQWLDNVERDIWKVIPGHASYIVTTQGDLTPDEELRYQGWSYTNASLRISVDRRLSRLRQIRSQIGTPDKEVSSEISWLEQLQSQDIDNLAQRIKVEVRQIDFVGLNDKVPHLKLFVRLVNASIFKVKLLRCDGYIQLSGIKCEPPQIDQLPELGHGTNEKVELHQGLNDATAQWLKEQAETNTTVTIVCIMCQFIFQVTSEGYNKQVEIPINEGGLSCIPKGIVVIFNGNIGRVTN